MSAEKPYLFRHSLLHDVETPQRGCEKVELCETAGIAPLRLMR